MTTRARTGLEALGWFLEGRLVESRRVWRVPIGAFPFRVGRGPGLGLTLLSDSVSGLHAEIYKASDGLAVRDLDSTNGTFVNHCRVSDSPIREGDLLHFAEVEFRVGRAEPGGKPSATVRLSVEELHRLPMRDGALLARLLEQGLVSLVFQPIVALDTLATEGHEVLGRGRAPGLPESPSELFAIAASLGVTSELGRLFRSKLGPLLSAGRSLGTLFLNCHPDELGDPAMFESLAALQKELPQQALALEIHESYAANLALVSDLRSRLRELGVKLAYDDFGVGQARIVELGEAPPDYLKFDTSLIRGLDVAKPSRRRLLSSLVSAAHDLGAETIAEGVETEGELEACREVGFSHGQGYQFRRPVTIEEL